MPVLNFYQETTLYILYNRAAKPNNFCRESVAWNPDFFSGRQNGTRQFFRKSNLLSEKTKSIFEKRGQHFLKKM